MPTRPDVPQPFSSPIQEQHIDFLLEEEFSCSASFLAFFLEQARARRVHPIDGPEQVARMTPYETWKCEAIRSATTNAGETDVLVVFQSADESLPRVAILIEDKIRATFQKEQAARYQQRGDAGQQAGLWDHFFTCLVAPEKYSKDNAGFGTFVSLESILNFFSAEDHRTRFKARVFERALANFATSGVQNIDVVMTAFRAAYAQAANNFFQPGEVVWDQPRDAWYDDSWFYFRHSNLPSACKIVYKPKMGAVELSFPSTAVANLDRILAESKHSNELETRQTGKSAAIRTSLSAVSDFGDISKAAPAIQQSLLGVRRLLSFYNENAPLFETVGTQSWK